jgi:hypothetical protein
VRTLRGTKAGQYKDGILSTSRRHAETIVRTAANHISNAARDQVWQANSDIVRGVRWTSTLDGRTSLTCQSRDGHVAPIGDKPLAPGEVRLSPPDARPPAHPNCRSVVVAVLDGLGIIGERPTVRDRRTPGRREVDFRRIAEEEGKTIQQVRSEWADANVGRAPAATNYEQWLRGQDPDFQDQVLGKSRAAMFREGASIGDFVTSTGQPKRVADLSAAKAAPNVRQAIRRELLAGGDPATVLKRVQEAYPAAKVSPQQVGLIRKSLVDTGMIAAPEAPIGVAKAAELLEEFQQGLPPHVQSAAPPGWANIVQSIDGYPPGLHTFGEAGGKVNLSGTALGKMSKDRARATMANALGRILRDQAIGPLDPDLVTGAYKAAQGFNLGPLGISGEVLFDELFGLALNPGPVTSWGTASAPIMIRFGPQIEQIQALIAKALAPKAPTPPASAAFFPVTGHQTVKSYAQAMFAAGHSVEDVSAAVKHHFPDSEVSDKALSAYKAQLGMAKKLANMPPKAAVDAALKAVATEQGPEIKALYQKMAKGQLADQDWEPGSPGHHAKVLKAAFGSWGKAEAKAMPKVTAAPVPAVGLPLSPSEVASLAKQYMAMGPISKKAVAAAVQHLKAGKSPADVPSVMGSVFGTFDPVAGKPLLEMANKFAGMDKPPIMSYEAPKPIPKAAPKAAPKSSKKGYEDPSSLPPIVPARPARTPGEGHPPPPRFTAEQKRRAVLEEFRTLLPSADNRLSDIEYTVLHMYTGHWYDSVNTTLRNGGYANNFRLQAIAEIAQEAMGKLPPARPTQRLTRNIQIGYADLPSFLNKYRPGNVVEEMAFTSTSTDGVFGDGKNVRMIFTSHRSARSVAHISKYRRENEVLFSPGAKFRVKSMTKDGGIYVFEMEET